MLLFDPQTSGGLLLSVAKDQFPTFLQKADQTGLKVWNVGKVVDGEGIVVTN